MDIQNIRLSETWDGTDYIVLHQLRGFNFGASKFKNGVIMGDDFAFLFNDKVLDSDTVELLTTMINIFKSKKEEQDKKKVK